MITFADALKGMRRGIHVHGDNWRTLIVTKKLRSIPVAWREFESLTNASSSHITSEHKTKLVITLDKGGPVQFAAIEDQTEAYLYAGRQFTHIIWLYEPEPLVEKYVRSFLRSSHVPSEAQRVDFVEW